ncbi:MAG: hypothetical protein E7447_00770 [Ruminococcaceae bacterium]|nr:hypothetical protein [Oscillospiraceae bacterium]
MAQEYPCNWKNCATCAFWIANRDCDHFGQRAIVPSSSERGRCAIPSGGWRGSQRQANNTCSSWQKWPVLR